MSSQNPEEPLKPAIKKRTQTSGFDSDEGLNLASSSRRKKKRVSWGSEVLENERKTARALEGLGIGEEENAGNFLGKTVSLEKDGNLGGIEIKLSGTNLFEGNSVNKSEMVVVADDYNVDNVKEKGGGFDLNVNLWVPEDGSEREVQDSEEKREEIVGIDFFDDGEEFPFVDGRRKCSREEKGKGIVGDDDYFLIGNDHDVFREKGGELDLNVSFSVSEDGSGREVKDLSDCEGYPFVDERRQYTREEKGKQKVGDDDNFSTGNDDDVVKGKGGELDLNVNFSVSEDGSGRDFRDLNDCEECPFVDGGRRYSREEKGKARVDDDNDNSDNNGESDAILYHFLDFEGNEVDPDVERGDYVGLEEELMQSEADGLMLLSEVACQEGLRFWDFHERESAKERARINASSRRSNKQYVRDRNYSLARPAYEKEKQLIAIEGDKELEDFDCPFSYALKRIKEQNLKLNARQENLQIDWKPSRDGNRGTWTRHVPSLLDLSMDVLARHADAIVELEHVPETLKLKLSQLACRHRKMDVNLMKLLVSGSPTEVCVENCSWMTGDQLIDILRSWDTSNLKVLQIDLCGQCMTDDISCDYLSQSLHSFPALVTISLRGACHLSDIGLNALIKMGPLLQSVNLAQCSLLTSAAIDSLANHLGSTLRELYIDDCCNIDVLLILPALKELQHLEVLSVAGIQTVSDDFVIEVTTACGPKLKKFVLANCVELTDISLGFIAKNCQGLCALDLFNLHKLTDRGLLYLAKGCQSIQTLKLCRNHFSDEGVAAFLEVSGGSLKELSLNKVYMVGPNTALSLAKFSRNVLSLDLSWCRKLTDEALGLIVDSCLSLRLLKLFGCTQITDVFYNGHLNSTVQIIGLKGMPILKDLNVFGLQQFPLC